MMSDLFSDTKECLQLDLQDAEIILYPHFFGATEEDHYFERLIKELDWSQQRITVYGKQHDVPRLSAWYADDGKTYEYSGLRSVGLPWVPVLTELKKSLLNVTDQAFNSVLANLYRNGADSVGWHADDEPELGREPVIASFSFGEERRFQLKHKTIKSLRHSVILPHGSLLIMKGATQANWLHQIPKSSRPMRERVNLTFRQVK